MPVAFKNALDGDAQAAINAIVCAALGHTFHGSDPRDGGPATIRSAGNPDCCLVLRGGRDGPNYSAAHVASALDLLSAAGLPRRLMIDASHGNSGKDHRRQGEVAISGRRPPRPRRDRDHRCAAGKLPGRRPPGPGGRQGRAHLRPVHHRRLHRH